jgi:hypothetical protein
LAEQSREPTFQGAVGFRDLIGKKQFIEHWSLRLEAPRVIKGPELRFRTIPIRSSNRRGIRMPIGPVDIYAFIYY